MQIHIEHHDLVVDAEMNFVLEGQETVAGLTIPKWQTDAAEITVYRGVAPVQFVVGLGVKEKLDADLMRQAAQQAFSCFNRGKEAHKCSKCILVSQS